MGVNLWYLKKWRIENECLATSCYSLPNNAEYQQHGSCHWYHHLLHDTDNACLQLCPDIIWGTSKTVCLLQCFFILSSLWRKDGWRRMHIEFGPHSNMFNICYQEQHIATIAKDFRAERWNYQYDDDQSAFENGRYDTL